MQSDKLNALSNHPCFKQSRLSMEFSQKPLGFIDIGARGGVHELVEPFAKHTSVLGFEPDKKECHRLLNCADNIANWADFTLIDKALAEANTEKCLVAYEAATNDSLLEPNTDFTRRYKMQKWNVKSRTPLKTTTLDDIVFGTDLENCEHVGEFIKIDTQGTEYEILQGASRTLTERTLAVVCEVSFAEIYKNQKLFSDVEQYLRSFGFKFYGFDTLYSRSLRYFDKQHSITKERTIYTDALFFKDPLYDEDKVAKQSDRSYKALFVIAVLLGYYDFARELLLKTWLPRKENNEFRLLNDLLLQMAELPASAALEAIKKLYEQAKSQPEKANLLSGAFVQARKGLCDYADILQVSPLPKEWT